MKVYSADVDLTAIGGDSTDWEYAFKYDSIPGELIGYIGDAKFDEWVQDSSTAPHNMQTCIEYFNLTLDDVLAALDPPETTEYEDYLTISDVETLCSGDQAEINRTFVSPYAVVSESGDIYTIFWLAEHDAQDYEEAGLSAAAIEAALEQAAALEIDAVNTYIEQVEDSLAD